MGPFRATDLAGPLGEIASFTKPRGLIVLISNLLAPLDSFSKHHGYLRSRGHDLAVLRILDPRETDFAFPSPTIFQDMQTDRELYVDPTTARAEYQKRFAPGGQRLQFFSVSFGVRSGY